MPWLKVSDAAATHPIALAPLDSLEADDRIVNELFGFIARCAVMSAQHEKDYVVTLGTARTLAGGADRFRVLADAAARAGYWKQVTIEDVQGQEQVAFELAQEKDLFHMILKAERAWETQRRADVANTDLTVPVRLRDGDGCRWCGKSVVWRDRKSGRGATYDHVHPGRGAASPEDLVIACRSCNGARQDENVKFDRTLMPPPERPLYGADTLAFLAEHGATPAAAGQSTAAKQAPQRDTAPEPTSTAPVATAAGSTAPATAAPQQEERDTAGQERQRDTAARDAGRPAATAAATRTAGQVLARDLEEMELDAPPPDQPENQPAHLDVRAEGSGSTGTGRDGTGPGRAVPGRDGNGTGTGQGRDGSAPGERPSSGRRRRRRRGRRGGARGGERDVR